MTAPAFRLTDKLAAMIQPEHRKAHRILLPEERDAKAAAGAEKKLQADAEAYLRSAKGIQWIFHERESRGNKAGTPDLIFGYRRAGERWAILCGLELKAGDNKTSQAQDETMERMQMDGAAVAVCRSIPEIKAFLDNLETENKEQER